MAVLQVQSNGNAPAGASVGDYVNTAGGVYQITAPGTAGATYNPSSGYWSTKVGQSLSDLVSTYSSSALSNAQAVSKANSELSQSYAREQMNFQEEANAKAMSFNAEQAEKNRLWQEHMSNTAHQREVADLIAAGLNPILSANAGAAVTSGATASGVSSSGASGNVDTSANNLLASVLNALISQQTSEYVANTNAFASMSNAKTSAEATIASANINAKSQQYMQTISNEFQEYVYRNYPQTTAGAMSSLIEAFTDAFVSDASSGKDTNHKAEVFKKAADEFSVLFKKAPLYEEQKYNHD